MLLVVFGIIQVVHGPYRVQTVKCHLTFPGLTSYVDGFDGLDRLDLFTETFCFFLFAGFYSVIVGRVSAKDPLAKKLNTNMNHHESPSTSLHCFFLSEQYQASK